MYVHTTKISSIVKMTPPLGVGPDVHGLLYITVTPGTKLSAGSTHMPFDFEFVRQISGNAPTA